MLASRGANPNDLVSHNSVAATAKLRQYLFTVEVLIHVCQGHNLHSLLKNKIQGITTLGWFGQITI